MGDSRLSYQIDSKNSFTASYMLFRTLAKMKFVTSKSCVAIYNSFTNITLITISVFKLICLLDILRHLATFTIASGTFKFLDVFVCSFCTYQITFQGASFMQTNQRRILPQIKQVCAPRLAYFVLHLKPSENSLATDETLDYVLEVYFHY